MVSMSARGFGAAIGTLNGVAEGFTGNSRWVVGVGAEYGAYVEFGTSRMEAQPYLFPAARKVVRTDLTKIERRAMLSTDPVEAMVSGVALEIEAEAKRRAPVDTGNLRSSIEAVPAGEIL